MVRQKLYQAVNKLIIAARWSNDLLRAFVNRVNLREFMRAVRFNRSL